MVIPDTLKSWFLRNVIKPRTEEMDTPGYVVTRVGGKGTALREVFFPETLIEQLENNILDKYGEKGKEELYTVGKRFGWRYAAIADFPQLEDTSVHEFEKFFDFFVKYIEIIYASKISYTLDVETESFEMDADNYSVCRHNGHGYVLTTGAVAGVIAHLFNDVTFEAEQPRCQGRGDELCVVTCDEAENIDVEFEVQDLGEETLAKKYRKINEIREVKYANSSIKDLMDKGFFEYERGILSYDGERHVPAEASMIYLLEEMAGEGIQDLLFETAFSVGKPIGEEKKPSFVTDYLSALGWGDIRPAKDGQKVYVYQYPWTRYAYKTEFSIFRGLVSGIMSGIRGEETRYTDYQTKLSGKGFSVELTTG